MPKYYVQSGKLQLITTASDPRGAAIWAVHRALSHALPFLSEPEPADVQTRRPPQPQPQLGESVQVSEQGFDRPDGQAFDTLSVVTEWNQLLVAIDRLERRLATT
jgi:hypothetical protein